MKIKIENQFADGNQTLSPTLVLCGPMESSKLRVWAHHQARVIGEFCYYKYLFFGHIL